MIYKTIAQFHNVAEMYDVHAECPLPAGNVVDITPDQRWHGLRLQRVPEQLRSQLIGNGQETLCPAGIEIRFVHDGPVRLTLSIAKHREVEGTVKPQRMLVFHGDIRKEEEHTLSETPTVITIEQHPHIQDLQQRLQELDGKELPTGVSLPSFTFGLQVTRLRFPYRDCTVLVHDIEACPGTTCRPPTTSELPQQRLLSYGTSVTQGFSVSMPHQTYASECARHLGADLTNLGMAASCVCEPEYADYIAELGVQGKWDIATLALSLNMQGFSQQEFVERISYMVHRVASANPEKPVFAITLWPHWRDACLVPTEYGQRWPDQNEPVPTKIPDLANRMRLDLRDVVKDTAIQNGYKNLHLLEGVDLFGPFSGLCADLIHPSEHGATEMGRKLAEAIRPFLKP